MLKSEKANQRLTKSSCSTPYYDIQLPREHDLPTRGKRYALGTHDKRQPATAALLNNNSDNPIIE